MTYKNAEIEIDTRIRLALKYDLEVPVPIEALELAWEALIKQILMKPYDDDVNGKCCPVCLERVTFQTWEFGLPITKKMEYCQDCGQALDWREE